MTPAIGAAPPVLRVARASSDLRRARRFYCDALGLAVLGEFLDHAGFDGLIVGVAGAQWHLELVHQRGVHVARPSVEDLIVLYEPDAARHAEWIARVVAAGFAPVQSNNPYWDRCGRTFEDDDGHRTVIAARRWPR